jgi:hypothetical protein
LSATILKGVDGTLETDASTIPEAEDGKLCAEELDNESLAVVSDEWFSSYYCAGGDGVAPDWPYISLSSLSMSLSMDSGLVSTECEYLPIAGK